MNGVACTSCGGGAPRPFWRRRVADPLASLLSQGFTPGGLARALGLGAVCGVFPFLGATTALTTVAGLALRLNQPVMHTVNQLLTPVQLGMIPVFVQTGAWMLGADGSGFSVSAMIDAARGLEAAEFLRQFGQAGLFALVAWVAAAPLLFAAVFFTTRPMLVKLVPSRIEGGQRQ